MAQYVKKALVLGAGGFIGSHMVKRLKSEGYWVRGVDLKYPEFSKTAADEFVQGDLCDLDFVRRVLEYKGDRGNFYRSVPYRYIQCFDEIYQFAADMGGAGFVFTGENDADIMHNSVQINLNVLECQRKMNEQKGRSTTKIFYSGSACMYPEHNQLDPNNPDCRENQHIQQTQIQNMDGKTLRSLSMYNRNTAFLLGLLAHHNIFNTDQRNLGQWKRESTSCNLPQSRQNRSRVDLSVWGDGLQTRSFLFVDECIEATRRLMDSNFIGPVNIGSEEMVTINQLVDTVAERKIVTKIHIDGPLGVRGRNSNNDLIHEKWVGIMSKSPRRHS